MIQTGQIHSDLLFYTLFSNSNGQIEIGKIYRDIKADYKGTSRGHITLKPFIFRDYKLVKQHMNDYITTLTEKALSTMPWYKLLTENKKDIIKKVYNELLILRNKCTINSTIIQLEKIMLEFNKIIVNMSLDPMFVQLGINFTIATDIDVIDHEFENLLSIIETNIDNNPNILDIDVLFPKNNKISINMYKDLVLTIIKTIIPEHLKKNY